MKETYPVLKVKDVSKYFGKVRALYNVSFELERGKILGFVGDNGAGRSTLLKILSGDIQPSSGKIYLEGKETHFKSPADAMKKGLAITYQFLGLVDIAKVWENFFMGRELTKKIGPLTFLDVSRMRNITSEAIVKYGQKFDIEREVKDLSGGQRQIVAVTRAIEANPKILLLDEPFHGLSKRIINEIFDFLRRAKKEKGTSIIITSQWYEQISDLIDNVIVLWRGEIVGNFDVKSANKANIFKLAMGLKT